MRAFDLSQQGWDQREIATALDVSKGAVSRWLAAARQGGVAALRSHPILGRFPKLTWEQRCLIPDFLWHGAEAYGFRGDVWTCPRVGKVIKEEFDVSYSRSQVSRLLKEFGWTPQVPVTLAIQRDETAIERWRVEVWPKLKKQARREHRTLVFTDESGFYLLPGVVKTYAPEGLTPVLYEWQTHDHLSVMGAVTPKGRIYSLVRQKSFNGLHTIEFLDHLLRVTGERLLVVWDGSPIHRRQEVKEYLAGPAAGRIRIEPLPAYAPDLNPVEWLWKHLKKVELRNVVCLDLEELHGELHLALGRVRQKPRLVPSFFAGAILEL